MENDIKSDDTSYSEGLWSRSWGLIPRWVKNKYFIALSTFVVIMLFLDRNDVFTSMARNKELRNLEQSRVYYTKEINELNKIKEGLAKDPQTIEKFAREKYLMKRENEDIFIVPEKSGESNN